MASPGSPLSGQPTPPEGYKLDVAPPEGYALDQSVPESPQSIPPPTPNPEAQSPEVLPQAMHPVLQQVLKENPGLAQNFNADNTSLVFASGDRRRRGLKERGGLEFWPPDEKGDNDFAHPSPGKNVLEIYDDKLKNNPTDLKQAVYGDLMHGMSQDPYWKDLRTKFMQSFTLQELKRQTQHKTWWEDVNGSKDPLGAPTYDAYIRGWVANEGEGKTGQVKSGNTMYSPKQIQLLQKMQDYLKTGNVPKVNPELPKKKPSAPPTK